MKTFEEWLPEKYSPSSLTLREYKLMRAAYEAALEQSQWQPIETCPKDDDELILLSNHEGVWAGKYLPVYQSGFKPSNPWSSMLLNHDHIRFNKSLIPTHWMPLPKPPGEDE